MSAKELETRITDINETIYRLNHQIDTATTPEAISELVSARLVANQRLNAAWNALDDILRPQLSDPGLYDG
jgi:predicted  nucleic acid-binding Zn-ribbon protein